MKNAFLIVLLIITYGCTTKSSIKELPLIEGWQRLDLKTFELQTPIGYELKEGQGYDSYVGKVTNEKITFSFDYGWYSDSGPTSNYQYNFIVEKGWKFHKKIYYPKNNMESTESGIFIEERTKIFNRNPPNSLAFYTSNTKPENIEEIIQILKTIKIKE